MVISFSIVFSQRHPNIVITSHSIILIQYCLTNFKTKILLSHKGLNININQKHYSIQTHLEFSHNLIPGDNAKHTFFPRSFPKYLNSQPQK